MQKPESYWKKVAEKYEHANLSKAEFCKQNKLPLKAFYYWCNKLRPDLKLQNNIAIDVDKNSLFLPVKKENCRKNIDIIFNGSTKLSFNSLPEPAWIANLLKSMDIQNVQHQ